MTPASSPNSPLTLQDPEVATHLAAEIRRQKTTLEMIASENYASEAVLEASGSVFTNKYAEGYPGKRYYHGCGEYDAVETLAIERACRLFGADYANVQPHSGTTANQGVFMATISPGDTVLSLSLAHGGHLSHGHKVNMAGKLYNIVQYGVSPKTETIDFDEVGRLAREHKPKLLITGGSAYPRLIDFAKFREIADEVGATFLVDMAHFAGLVAGQAIPSPVPHAHVVSTTTHKTLRGPRGGLILANQEFGKKINSSIFPGLQGGPLMHQVAAKAVAFGEALKPSFRDYARQVIANAKVLGEVLVENGMRLVAGGTDTHLVLVDLTPVGVTGKAASDALEDAGITINMNMIPFDTRKPTECSGIRIGTPVLTSRGMKEAEIRTIAAWIAEVVKNVEDQATIKRVRAQVEELASAFPMRANEG
ncbi:MAG: glycine hydroxymethyltransferase [Candidatus Sumerlaeota bacterium]|nr:glycine hydroxymethyltransferase [Candidatus Sumerlaeota bacterium]